jgi:hypothetical protein
MRPLDLAGQRFGLLSVVERAGKRGSQALWRCKCDCGAECTKTLGNLRSGHTKSCGCLRSTVTTEAKTKHAMYGTPTYRSWSSMLTRCNTPSNHKYPDYGGRGITVHGPWHDFATFLADMGERPSGTTLGRQDNDGNYEPGNCSWETDKQQGRNKRNTKLFEFEGITATLPEHCERLGLNTSTIRSRVYTYGFSIEKALTQPNRN